MGSVELVKNNNKWKDIITILINEIKKDTLKNLRMMCLIFNLKNLKTMHLSLNELNLTAFSTLN